MRRDPFKKMLEKKAPVIRVEPVSLGSAGAKFLVGNNIEKTSSFPGYAEAVEKLIKMREKAGQGRDNTLRVFLVSSDQNLIRKTALMLTERVINKNQEDEEEYELICDEEESGQTRLLEVSLDIEDTSGETGRKYIVAHLACSLTNDAEKSILYTGLNLASFESQLEAIECFPSLRTFVALPPELLSRPELQRFYHEQDYEVLILDKLEADYYKEVFEGLVSDGKISFESEEFKDAVFYALLDKNSKSLCEEIFSNALFMAKARAQVRGAKKLAVEDFSDFLQLDNVKAKEELFKLTGLNNLKKTTKEFIAVRKEEKINPKLFLECRHMIFAGNPGTGKTSGAQLLADICRAEGIGNGVFVCATRKDLIGEYVGHTAPKVAKAFEKARGGILFVDEAGFFLNKGAGGYVEEAMKEFVRYMELYRDVVVIFAMYTRETKGFLALDEGLASRIATVVDFPDYSMEELLHIFSYMLEKKGYTLKKEDQGIVREYILASKNALGKRFGNARQMRKLSDAVVREICLRHSEKGAKLMLTVTAMDLKKAVEKMNESDVAGTAVSFGFMDNRGVQAVV